MSGIDKKDPFWAWAIMGLGVIFFVHILLGAVLYVSGLALWRLFKAQGKNPIFWVGLSCFLVMTGVFLYYEGFFAFLSNNGIQGVAYWVKNKIYYILVVSLNLSERFSSSVANFLVNLSPAILLVPLGIVVKNNWGSMSILGGPKKEKSKKKKKIKPSKFSKYRDQEKEAAFMGFDEETNKPIYLSDRERGMHMQVVGSTGFGKTVSVLLPLLKNDLKQNRPIIFIDGKGDQDSVKAFLSLVIEADREKDAYIFSTTFPNISNKWNPLINGNPFIKKDRIIGAQIWSEEFYKKKGEELILRMFYIFDDLGIVPTFPLLSQFFTNPEADFIVKAIKERGFNTESIKDSYNDIKKKFKSDAKNYAGIVADINLLATAYMGKLFTDEDGKGINLHDALRNNKIVFFHLPVLTMEDTNKRIARMVIHDIKTAVGDIQNYTDPEDRPNASIYIDEFASFASESFIELLNKARSAGISITVLHQSLGDIESVSSNFARQIFENTNVKVILRIDDPESVEHYIRMGGTHEELKATYQTDMGLLGRSPTGAASLREVDAFNIDPNRIKSLSIGEGVILVKNSNRRHYAQLDYIKPKSVDITAIAKDAREMIMVSDLKKPTKIARKDGNEPPQDIFGVISSGLHSKQRKKNIMKESE